MNVNGNLLMRKKVSISSSEVAKKVYALAEKWQNEVEGISSTLQMSEHPAYQEIISFGYKVVPLLLKELKNNPLYWLSALSTITGENPIKPEHKGKIKQMAEAWIDWGKNKGCLIIPYKLLIKATNYINSILT
jgi:hypothetical protein